MLQHEYEAVVIIRPDIDDAATKQNIATIETLFADLGAELLLTDDWGKRKLAYLIRKHLKGHYVMFNFIANAELITEFERKLRINDDIIRFMTVRVGEAIDVESRRVEAAEERARREAEAAARAAAEAEAAAAAAAAMNQEQEFTVRDFQSPQA
jgi:small subunit ribosomal protein S6